MVEEAMAIRPDRPLTIVDIAVPRDVEPAARDVAGVRLHDLDDLQAVALETATERRAAIPEVSAIIEEELAGLRTWETRIGVEPTVRALHVWGDQVVARELEAALRKLPDLDDRARSVVAGMAAAIAGKLLHPPTTVLKAKSGDQDSTRYAATLRALFELDGRVADPKANGHAEDRQRAEF
jgi:glutamyl-tRNA reductase